MDYTKVKAIDYLEKRQEMFDDIRGYRDKDCRGIDCSKCPLSYVDHNSRDVFFSCHDLLAEKEINVNAMKLNIEIVMEYEPRVDWSKVEVDTKILVRDSKNELWKPRYFAKYENEHVYTYNTGWTSFTNDSHFALEQWKYAKLYKETPQNKTDNLYTKYSDVTAVDFFKKRQEIFDNVRGYSDIGCNKIKCNDCPFSVKDKNNTKKCINILNKLELLIKLVMEYEPKVDWNKVEVDTKIFVRDTNGGTWKPRYFAKYKNGCVYAFNNGSTSFSNNGDVFPCNYAKLYKEDDAHDNNNDK